MRYVKRFLVLLLALCLLSPAALADNRTYYEIFPASFYDSNGDGMGDLDGITEKIPYLTSLGVEGIWLMPIHPSPSYHKYDVTDYMAVADGYGTVDSLRTLADALHAEDMTLLLDMVINHTSSQHPWFLSAIQSLPIPPCSEDVCALDPTCRAHNPYIDYYHFAEEAIPGWHTVPGAPGWYYEGGFTYEMPDLNLDSPNVRAEIHTICAFWLAQGVDGFRLDAVLHYFGEDIPQNIAFLTWLMEDLRAMNPEIYVVGEAWKDAGTIGRYYESGISSLFNFPFSGADGAIVKAIREGKGAIFAQKAADWQAIWAAHEGASDAPFLSNHDNARIAGTLMRDPQKLKMAASLYLTLPGSPFLYYGEELGMTGSGRDENKRLPMLWDAPDSPGACLPPAAADQEATFLASVEASLADDTSLLAHYQTLLAIRKAHPALRTGTIAVLDTGISALCAYALTEGEDTVTVLHNVSKKPVTITLDGETLTIEAMSSLICPTGEACIPLPAPV